MWSAHSWDYDEMFFPACGQAKLAHYRAHESDRRKP